jgi:hypothetical protein
MKVSSFVVAVGLSGKNRCLMFRPVFSLLRGSADAFFVAPKLLHQACHGSAHRKRTTTRNE